ncbi:hypothetical protein [Dechloromonas agitata]|uniref:hypothetical protein n=1 Tax=Dechloromonas agitata TaxID=73030 RepID=UPI0012FA375E|nr:hypothetical protein [Dechloromonas agitata]
MKSKIIALLTAALTLGGCVNVPKSLSQEEIDARINETKAWKKTLPVANADYGSYPSDSELLLKKYFSKNLKDPESARYGDFSKPIKRYFIRDEKARDVVYGYAVCVSVNAKNSYGGYTGAHDYWFFIRNGEIVKSYDTEEIMFGVKVWKNYLADCKNGV